MIYVLMIFVQLIFLKTRIKCSDAEVQIFTAKSFSMCVLSYDFPGWLPTLGWLKPSMKVTKTTPPCKKIWVNAQTAISYCVLTALIQRPSTYHTIRTFSQTDPLVDRIIDHHGHGLEYRRCGLSLPIWRQRERTTRHRNSLPNSGDKGIDTLSNYPRRHSGEAITDLPMLEYSVALNTFCPYSFIFKMMPG